MEQKSLRGPARLRRVTQRQCRHPGHMEKGGDQLCCQVQLTSSPPHVGSRAWKKDDRNPRSCPGVQRSSRKLGLSQEWHFGLKKEGLSMSATNHHQHLCV